MTEQALNPNSKALFRVQTARLYPREEQTAPPKGEFGFCNSPHQKGSFCFATTSHQTGSSVLEQPHQKGEFGFFRMV